MFKLSENHNPNYLATICKIGELYPIENADRLKRTVVNGYDIVVGIDTQPGDIVIYFPIETKICNQFLKVNNLYEVPEMNANFGTDDTSKGFFNKHGRVRIVKLRGIYSSGFICKPELLVKAFPELMNINFEEYIGTSFDTIGTTLFCEKYIPFIKERVTHVNKEAKRNNKLKRFDKLIPDTFKFHYDTKKLNENIYKIKPTDIVSITVKLHGTSGIFAKIPIKRKLTFIEKVKKFFGIKVSLTEMGNIYSSRAVIKNQYINNNVKSGFYESDVWSEVNKIVYPLLYDNMIVYGEIVGFIPNTPKYIQKNHDYGCRTGEWKFMPYRIVTRNSDRDVEWEVTDVIDWTNHQIKNGASNLIPMTLLHHGTLTELYPLVSITEHWHENILACMKEESRFLMECNEPLCRNKVPREGIVIRIDGDPIAEAFKLKTNAHYKRECAENDAGEINIEDEN